MSESDARSRVEHLLSLPTEERAREAATTQLAEPVLLEMIDEVRDLVMSDLDRAIAMGELLRVISDRLELPTAMARSRSAWAHALNYANRFDEAIAALEEASRIAQSDNDPLEDARACLARAQSLARLGKYEDAIGACVHAERIFEERDEPELTLRAVTNHAIILRMLGRWAESVERFDRALSLARLDPTLAAQIQSNRAESLLELGQFEDAERAFRQSCELLETAGMERVAAIVRGNLADLLGRQGRLSESIRQFERARRFFERDRASGDLARIEAELADVFAATGLSVEAIDLYSGAVEALDAAGMAAEHARALTGLGALLLETDTASAKGPLERAASAWDTLGNHQARVRTELLMARAALLECDLGRASALASLESESAEDSHVNKIIRRTILADVLTSSSQPTLAQELLHEAIDIAEQLGLPAIRADLHHRLGRVISALGQSEAALVHFRHSITEIERIRGALQGDRFRAAFLGDHSLIYQHTADELLKLDRPGAVVEAFDIAEQARARALLDAVQGGVELAESMAEGASNEDRSLLESLARARARVNYLLSRIDPAAADDASPVGGEWLELLSDAEAEVSRIESRLTSSGRVRSVLATPVPVREIAETIPEGSAVLVYAPHGDSIACYRIRHHSVQLIKLRITADELDEACASFSFQLRRAVVRGQATSGRADRRRASAITAAQRLFDAVIRPVLPALDRIERIAIVPTGSLHAIPFSSLHDGDRYLVERFRIARAPSASISAGISSSANGTRAGGLVIGASDRYAPEIRSEAEAVADALPGSRLLLDDSAVADQVIDAMSQADVVHIASHGMFPPGNALAAAIKMADRWLTAREIFSLRLNGSVIVLSGCETGRSEVDRGEESYGFVRAFLAAGAGGVITSLWASHDRIARTLMTDMYTLAPERGTPAERMFSGLRAAQLKAIKNDLHPGLWSGFTAVGAG